MMSLVRCREEKVHVARASLRTGFVSQRTPGGNVHRVTHRGLSLRGLSRVKDDLAHRLTARQDLQGVGGLRQRESAVDMRRDLTFGGPLHELLKIGAIFVRIEARPMAPEHTANI